MLYTSSKLYGSGTLEILTVSLILGNWDNNFIRKRGCVLIWGTPDILTANNECSPDRDSDILFMCQNPQGLSILHLLVSE